MFRLVLSSMVPYKYARGNPIQFILYLSLYPEKKKHFSLINFLCLSISIYRPESANKTAVCIIPSFGERYFTHPMFDGEFFFLSFFF